jgi:hypothetical protein
MTKTHLLSGALLLSLAACGGAKNGATGNGQAAGNGSANAAAANSAAPAGNAAAANEEDHHGDNSPRVLLTATGLVTDGASDGEVRFGATRSAALAMVTPIWGAPSRTENVEDCGGSGAAQQADFGAVVLIFQGDKLVGWEQRDASETPWIGTPGGASVGMRRPQLKDALGGAMRVEQSSLGAEFSGGGVSGLLASDRPDAQVDRLWAGNNCAMR